MIPQLLLSAFVSTPQSSFIEWVAYHRAIGATKIVIFVDQRNVEQHPLLNALAGAGILSVVPVVMGSNFCEETHLFSLGETENFDADKNGYRLYLQPDEYFVLHGAAPSIQDLIRSCDFPEVVSVPTRIAGIGPQLLHEPGPILQGSRPVALIDANKVSARIARLGLDIVPPPHTWADLDTTRATGLFGQIAGGLDGNASCGTKASVVKIPAPTIETFLVHQQARATDEQGNIEEQIGQLKSLMAIKDAPLAVEAWQDATTEQYDALMALQGVADAHEALCSMEIETCKRLRASSSDFQRVLAATIPEPIASAPTSSHEVLPQWLAEISLAGECEGFYTRLKHHAVVCIHRDPKRLAVTFDNLSSVNDTSPDREPWGYKFVRENGYSHLSVMARRKDWYRDPQLIAYLERLSADGFFEAFDKVIFAGTSMGGFAALAFASLSPGATVISFSPQTTLEPAIVPWEARFSIGRKRDWSLPYSDCAFEIDGVGKAIVLFDPFFEPDRRHAERLEGDKLMLLKTWGSGHFSPVFLRRAGLLKPVMQHAFDDTLTPEIFYRMFRARRLLPWYRNSMIDNLNARGHEKLAARVTPAFRKLKLEKSVKENS